MKNLGPIEKVNINDALEEVANKKDFGGILFSANFVVNYFPFSYQNEMGQLRGIMFDILNVAAKSLNVTLKYQDSKPQNFNKWSKR